MILTVGHGAVTAEELGDLLADAGVDVVVDVRRYPGSRRHPQFGRDEMSRWLPARKVEYRWEERLGGRRKPDSDSPHVGLRNAQFRAYADHMSTDEFRAAVVELVELADERQVAVMCSESVWWRCHRRLVADHLVLVEGQDVDHLFHDGRVGAHPVTEGAHRDGDRVVYGAPTLPLDII